MKKRSKIEILTFCLLLFSHALWGDSPLALYEEGRSALFDTEYFDALDYFKQALHINPAYVDALKGMAEAYFLLGEYEEARQYAGEARKGAEQRIDIINLQGRIFLGLGDLDGAESLFDQALNLEPNNMDASYGKAEIAVFRGSYREGTALFERSLMVNPDSRRALLSLVVLFREAGDFSRAEYYLSRSLKLFPQDPMVIREAIDHYISTGDWEQAEALAVKWQALSPGNSAISVVLGSIYKNTGRYQLAVDQFQDGIRYRQEDPLLWFLLGQSFAGLEKYHEALIAFRTVNIISPGDEIARISAENLLMERYPLNHEERLRAAAYHFSLGKEFESRYLFDKAFQEYRRGRLLSPLDLDGWWSYTRILKSLGSVHKYREEMAALEREQYDDPEFLRVYELLMSSEDLSLESRWNKPVVRRDSSVGLSLFMNSAAGMVIHEGCEEDLVQYVGDLLKRNPRFMILETGEIRTDAEAYRMSRSSGSDFYGVLTVSEMERTVRVRCVLYLSRTGTPVTSFELLRSGNRRVTDILAKTAQKIEAALPLKGYLMSVDENDVLINLGYLDGMEEGTELMLLRQGTGRWLDAEPYTDYRPEDLLGVITVGEVQEQVSQGTLKRNSPFDLVNPGDEVFIVSEDMGDLPLTGRTVNEELKSQLLKLY